MFRKILLFLALSVIFFFNSTHALAALPLEGEWQHDGKPTIIKRVGFGTYLFCNEDQNCARGYQTSKHHIDIPRWNVTGSFHRDTIRWSNRTTWVRAFEDGHSQSLTGTWYHSNQPTSIRVLSRSNQFLLTNEYGQTSRGYIRGRFLVIPSLNVRGKINRHQDKIEWSNNTVWHR